MIDKLLGTIKTDNQIGFSNDSIVKVVVGGFVSAVLAGITIKWLAKLLGL
jgi:hypothetical protein